MLKSKEMEEGLQALLAGGQAHAGDTHSWPGRSVELPADQGAYFAGVRHNRTACCFTAFMQAALAGCTLIIDTQLK
jgi:hypothetical protein